MKDERLEAAVGKDTQNFPEKGYFRESSGPCSPAPHRLRVDQFP
jgi:hypothetical protein